MGKQSFWKPQRQSTVTMLEAPSLQKFQYLLQPLLFFLIRQYFFLIKCIEPVIWHLHIACFVWSVVTNPKIFKLQWYRKALLTQLKQANADADWNINNYWMDWHEIWYRYQWWPEDESLVDICGQLLDLLPCNFFLIELMIFTSASAVHCV